MARRSSRWDQSGGATPVAGTMTPGGGITPGGGVTPGGIGGDTPKLGSKWDDETPRAGGFGAGDTPAGRKKSRWDQVKFFLGEGRGGGRGLFDACLRRWTIDHTSLWRSTDEERLVNVRTRGYLDYV